MPIIAQSEAAGSHLASLYIQGVTKKTSCSLSLFALQDLTASRPALTKAKGSYIVDNGETMREASEPNNREQQQSGQLGGQPATMNAGYGGRRGRREASPSEGSGRDGMQIDMQLGRMTSCWPSSASPCWLSFCAFLTWTGHASSRASQWRSGRLDLAGSGARGQDNQGGGHKDIIHLVPLPVSLSVMLVRAHVALVMPSQEG